MPLSVLLATAAAHELRVYYPPSVSGRYPVARYTFSPVTYEVDAELAIAASCPCAWLEEAPALRVSNMLEGRVLLLADGSCSGGCLPYYVACATWLSNASGLILSQTYNEDALRVVSEIAARRALTHGELSNEDAAAAYNASSFWVESEHFARLSNLSGCADFVLPTVGLGSNSSDKLWAAATGLPPLNESLAVNASNSSSLAKLMPLEKLINLTLAGTEEESSIDCSQHDHVPIVYSIATPIWGALSIVWGLNTYHYNLASTQDLHRMLSWVPLLQLAHCSLSFVYFLSCPWETPISLIYASVWAVLTILKEPVMLLCLLLVAKGWCITRHVLQRTEAIVAGLTLAFLYATVAVQLSMQSVYATVPMVMVYIVMLHNVLTSILANLRILKAQLFALRSLGVDPVPTPAYKKYRMFLALLYFTIAYAVLELFIHSIISLLDRYWLFIALHQAMEISITAGIGYQFRARPFNVLSHQMQQIATEIADQMLPRITAVVLKEDLFDAPNLIAWREHSDVDHVSSCNHQLPPTLVVLNPGDTEEPPPACAHRGAYSGTSPRSATAWANPSSGTVAANPRIGVQESLERSEFSLRRSMLRISSPLRFAHPMQVQPTEGAQSLHDDEVEMETITPSSNAHYGRHSSINGSSVSI